MGRISELLPKGHADFAIHRGARRRAERFPLQAQVDLLEPSSCRGYTINVSEGGVRVVLERAVAPGESCTIVLRTAGSKEYREHARVVWSREMSDGCIAGLMFTPDTAAETATAQAH